MGPEIKSELHTFSGHNDVVASVAIGPTDRFAVSSAHDQATPIFKVWDLRAALEVHTATGYMDYSQDGLHLRSAGFSQALQVRDLQAGTEAVLSLGGRMDRKTLFLPDGQIVITGDEAGRMNILRLEGFEYYGCEGILS